MRILNDVIKSLVIIMLILFIVAVCQHVVNQHVITKQFLLYGERMTRSVEEAGEKT